MAQAHLIPGERKKKGLGSAGKALAVIPKGLVPRLRSPIFLGGKHGEMLE
jgi:hypothetical protein